LKKVNLPKTNSEEVDEFEVVALAKRLNITFDDMKEMSYISLMNILLSSVEETSKNATQEDIDRMFG